jgi:hypothetical protein
VRPRSRRITTDPANGARQSVGRLEDGCRSEEETPVRLEHDHLALRQVGRRVHLDEVEAAVAHLAPDEDQMPGQIALARGGGVAVRGIVFLVAFAVAAAALVALGDRLQRRRLPAGRS